jgi:hypothetical protein
MELKKQKTMDSLIWCSPLKWDHCRKVLRSEHLECLFVSTSAVGGGQSETVDMPWVRELKQAKKWRSREETQLDQIQVRAQKLLIQKLPRFGPSECRGFPGSEQREIRHPREKLVIRQLWSRWDGPNQHSQADWFHQAMWKGYEEKYM